LENTARQRAERIGTKAVDATPRAVRIEAVVASI
jgi:hypothetical protein